MALTEQQQKQAEEMRQALEREMDNLGPGGNRSDIREQLRNKLELQILAMDTAQGAGKNEYFGAEKWDDAVQRYRDLGAQKREAVQIDQRQADQTRGLQMGALGTLENAAKGNAPSQAAITGQLQRGQILGQNTQALGGARGAAGGITAARQAGGAMGNQLVGSLAQTTMARAGEANQDRNAFVGAAGQVRGQDIGAATTNAELVAKSRAQDEARQQGFERMGWSTRNSQLQANVELERQEQAKRAEIEARRGREAAMDAETAKTAAGVGSSVVSSSLSFSDERTKRVLDMGSLAHMGRR